MNKTLPTLGYSSHKLGETEDSPFTDTEIRWTPLDDDGSEDEHERKGGARKKLGFEGLFDQSDPNPDNFDDVIGLSVHFESCCSSFAFACIQKI